MIHASLNMPFTFSAESTSEQTKLFSTVEWHNAECAKLEADGATLKATPEGSWDASHDRAAGKIRERKLSSLADEITIREKIDAFYDTVAGVDYPAAVNAAVAEFESSKTDVTCGLVSLGYINGTITDSSGSYIAGIDWHILSRHPRVSAARQAELALHGRPWHDAQGANRQALNKAKERAAEVKRRGVALLA
jgi:hypothetical protein